ncbi:MAG: hypothetical protein Kow0022_13790 [Phycisphaerales bacterium]
MSSVSPPSGLSNAISIAVARKALDVSRAQGEAAVELIRSAERVPKQEPPIQGGHLDVTG